MTTAELLAEEKEPKVLTPTMDVSIEEAEDTTYSSEHLHWRRRRCVYRPRDLTMTTLASAE